MRAPRVAQGRSGSLHAVAKISGSLHAMLRLGACGVIAHDFSRNLASNSSATFAEEGKLNPIGRARLRSSYGVELASYGSLSTMPNLATSSAKPRYLQYPGRRAHTTPQ